MEKSSPSEFIQKLIGQRVSIKLNTGVEYRGKLQCLDAFMNVVLDKCENQNGVEEWINGECKQQYGICFLRGNNVHYITPC